MYSLSGIFDKMADIANGGNVYGKKWLKQKLKLRYKDNIFFSEIDGKHGIRGKEAHPRRKPKRSSEWQVNLF